MKSLLATSLALFSLVVTPSAMAYEANNAYVLQEHPNLNPEIWEYTRPLRTVLHHTDPVPCEGKKDCVEIGAILEGPDGQHYVPSISTEDLLVWERSAISYVSALQIDCKAPATNFRVNYPHYVTTYGRDDYGRRVRQSRDLYTYYGVRTGSFQEELCKSLWSEGRRNAVDTLNAVACALDPKYCK